MRLTVSVPRRPLRSLALLLATALSLSVLMAVAPMSAAHAADPRLPSAIVDGGFIISDDEYFDGGSMTAAQAQKFLEARVPSCRATSGPTCLRDFTADIPAKAKDAYCAAIPSKKKARASEIIVAVGKACDISPKVILVMLQKEQGLVTSTKPSEWSYRAAMGMNCPDTAPCSAASAGFVSQVYLGARQQQVYAAHPSRYGYRAGEVNTVKWHPDSACGTSKVFIKNQATANLYIYTPYRPNIAALAAGYAQGDSCSSYGNRNFYNYYVQWFAPEVSPNDSGAPARVSECTTPPRADVAAASGTATVTAASAAVRKAPTLVCSDSTTSVKGSKLAVTGRYGSWVRVTDGAGSTRWVSASAVRQSGEAPAGGNACVVPAAASIRPAGGVVTVTSASLNARRAPSVSCDAGKTTLGRSDAPRRTGIYGEWWRITHAGSTYWIHSDFATVAAPITAISPAISLRTTAAIPLRNAPMDGATVLRTVAAGTAVKVTAASGKWRKTTIGANTGWLSSTKLQEAPATPTVEEAEGQLPVSPTVTFSTTSAIPLRAAASLEGAVLADLSAATFVEVTAQAGRWRLVAVVGSGQRGWVSSRALEQRSWGSEVSPTVSQRTVSGIPLRPAPSTATPSLGTLPAGTGVVVSKAYGKWRFVTVGGRTGWVSGLQLESTLPGTPVLPNLKMITASAIPLRPTPTSSNTPVTTLAKGTTVVVSRQSGKWRYVTVGSRSGWVSGLQLISAAAPSTTTVRTMKTKSEIPLRSAPSASAKPVTTVRAGTKVVVTGEKGRWRKVTVGSRSGWMSSLQLTSASSTWVTTASLNMRTGPTSTAGIVTVLPQGASVVVKGAEGGWLRVTAGSRTGWVSAAYLR